MHFILGVKSWSSVTIGETPKPVVGHKSPYFQDEFPSLASTGDEKGKEGDKKDTDVKEQYGPGPSLRPQSKDLRIVYVTITSQNNENRPFSLLQGLH